PNPNGLSLLPARSGPVRPWPSPAPSSFPASVREFTHFKRVVLQCHHARYGHRRRHGRQPDEFDGAGWTTALGSWRGPATKRPPPSGHGKNNASVGYRTANGPTKSLIKQVTEASRLPKLPRNEIKVIIRPKGGLDVSKADVVLLAQALAMAAALTEQQTCEDTVCPNKVQNILIISTPHEFNARAYVSISKLHTKFGTFEASAYIAASRKHMQRSHPQHRSLAR
ncbi:hypothetical protein MTO96_040907, partial [Rhipicephalus appendiculatus]